jgi:spore coat protein A
MHEGDTEVWEIVNLTMDAHPIHTHLTQFQLLNRQDLNTDACKAAYAKAFPTGNTSRNTDRRSTSSLPLRRAIPAAGTPISLRS